MGFSGNVLKLDKNNNVEDFTFVLSTKNYEHIGKLNNISRDTVHYKANLNGANELSFEVYKSLNGKIEEHWDRIIDLKSVYVKELNEYFQIKVTYKDELNEVKVLTCTSLCEAELSQTIIYDTEINTEDDITRDDYVITKFYDPDNVKASLLHRILSKAPHYKIKYVDSSLNKLQRSFSISGTSIYDFLVGECAEQFNCLFAFNSVDRSIRVYDLYTECAACRHRGDFNDVCPECGSTELNYFNEDTQIFVNKENLTDCVTFETDVDSIKNCFRLVAGDDDMTAAIKNLNQNGSQYIYYITPEQEEDMSEELVARLSSYDERYNSYTEEYEQLTQDLYDVTDGILYYTSGMMPTPEGNENRDETKTVAENEAMKLTSEKLSPVGVKYDSLDASKFTNLVKNGVLNYAKLFVNTGKVKIEVDNCIVPSSASYEDSSGRAYIDCDVSFKLTNYRDENDIAYTNALIIRVYEDYEMYVKQKIMKDITINEDEYAMYDVLEIDDINLFSDALEKYCLSRLRSFEAAILTAISILQELDQASQGADLYGLFELYSEKLQVCQAEISVRNNTISELQDTEASLKQRRHEIQKELDFEDYLGKELYTEFCAYRREQEYNNSNYISDVLDNAEIIKNAKDFLDTAKKELQKSATRQHSISCNLYNLLAMPEFKDLVDKFKLGNFIRVQAGKGIYRLRLVSYEINFSDLNTINVEFSDMTRCVNDMSDVSDILSSAASMATTYGHISKQAEKGENANNSIENAVQEGLNSANIMIKNNVREDIVINSNGILARSYDDTEGEYDPEMFRITHNIIAFSDDGFRTCQAALGKHKYTFYDPESKTFKDDIGYGLSSKFVQAGYVYSTQVIGGDIYSENYSSTKGTHLNLNDGSFSFAGGKLKYDETNGLFLQGKVNITDGGKIGTFSIIQNNDYSAIYSGTNSISSNTKGIYLGTNGIRQYESDTANVTIADGVLTANGANIKGTINATSGTLDTVTATNLTVNSGKIGGWSINSTTLTAGNITLNSAGSLSGGSTYTWSIGTDGTATFNKLTANNASINGTITTGNLTATGGKIANFTISGGYLYNGIGIGTAKSCGISCGSSLSGSDDYIFWAGNGTFRVDINGKLTCSNLNATGGSITGGSINIGSGKFTVSSSGVMTCTGADIGGRVDLAENSTLGGWKTDSNSIFKGTWGKNPTNLVFMCTGSTGTVNIAGVSKSWVFGAAPNFGVTKTGELYCSAGKIGGVTIYDDGSLRGGRIGIFPDGQVFTGNSNTFYYVIYNSNGSPVGGLTTSGWKTF